MLSVDEARERILAHFAPLPAEDVPLPAALGRVLAADAVAQEALPAFANTAMDGYAVRSTDTLSAAAGTPVRLRLAGAVPAGSVYPGTLAPGEAVRILTGAPLPDGADAVLEQERTRAGEGWVELLAPAPAGTNVRYPGEDVRPGTVLAPRGTELGPAEIALLAALGVHPVRVTRRPRVAVLSTGDELAPLGEAPRRGQIRESNGPYLLAAVQRAGAEALPLGIARDREDELRAKLAEARQADLILTSGGVSVGDYDLVKQILAEQGTMEFWRVRLRPGKPLAFGFLGTTPLLGLPGNPVSAAVTFELFGRPAIRTLLGAAQVERPVVDVVLEGEAIERADRRQFIRARLESRNGTLVARPTGAQGSHILSSLRGATALLVVFEGEGFVHAGEHLPALLLNDLMPWGW
ncbi:MAG: gephyrin-like molybdotransferase Glp [Ktedonobacterales bacterium]